MNWSKGLRRLWMVGTALWIVTVLIIGFRQAEEGSYTFGGVAQGVWAMELYTEYWYYRIFRPGVVGEARRVLSDPCVPRSEREQEEAAVARLEAEEAKLPPQPPLPDGTKRGTRSQIARILMLPECSAEVAEAKSELRDVGNLPVSVEGGWVPGALLSLAYWLFGPPIAGLVVGASLLWTFRGFRRGAI
jgi:hypothetical protein